MDNEYEEEMRHTTEKIKRIRRMREKEKMRINTAAAKVNNQRCRNDSNTDGRKKRAFLLWLLSPYERGCVATQPLPQKI